MSAGHRSETPAAAAGSAGSHASSQQLPWHVCPHCTTWVWEWRLRKSDDMCLKCGNVIPYKNPRREKDKVIREEEKARFRRGEADLRKGKLPVQKPSQAGVESGQASSGKWEQAIHLLASYLGDNPEHDDRNKAIFESLAKVAPGPAEIKAVDPIGQDNLEQRLKEAKRNQKKAKLQLEEANDKVRNSATNIRNIKSRLESENINWTSAKEFLAAAQRADKHADEVIKELNARAREAARLPASAPPDSEDELPEADTSPSWGGHQDDIGIKRKEPHQRGHSSSGKKKAIKLTAAAHTDAAETATRAKAAIHQQGMDEEDARPGYDSYGSGEWGEGKWSS